jgi:hypothetical protein
MMKATFIAAGEQVTLLVCGRLSQPWVAELERCWGEARASHPGCRISVDLCGVTFINEEGARLLRYMHESGASLVAEGLLVRELVDQITGGVK